MLTRKIAMMVAAGSAVAVLSGCGVPQEEHDAKVAELNDAWAEIETLKGKNADAESLLSKEKGKVRSTRIELDDASKRIADLKKKEAVAVSALADEKAKISDMESAVASAESSVAMAQDEASEAEATLGTLTDDYEKLKSDFEQYKRNMRSISGSPAPKASAPKASGDSGSALDILNEMSMQ
jgi:chromosome segregation ATPase